MSTMLGDSPIVATSDANVREAEFMDLILKSIFNSEKWRSVREKIHSLVQQAEAESYPEICRIAENYLVIELQKASGDVHCNYISALGRLRQFVLRAGESESAYKVQAKPNWKAVFWPNPGAPEPHGRSLYDEDLLVQIKPLISKSTPIGSAGSCFAMEIAKYLRASDFNYVVTEPNANSCAAWGTLYNSPSFRQLVEAAFGVRQRPPILFEHDETGRKQFWDPFREEIFYDSVAEYKSGTERHLLAAREALSKVKVFVMTIGLSEVWKLAFDDSVLARYPRNLASFLVYKQLLTVEQNLSELQTMLDVWRAHNPDLQLIITLSPVPLYATFRADECHVVQASCHSKSVLRVAIEEFVKRNAHCVSYFPAYEVVSYCTPVPFKPDGRHVTEDAVRRVTELFQRMFIAE